MKVIYESITKAIAGAIDKAESLHLTIDHIELTPAEFTTFKQEVSPQNFHLDYLAWSYMGIPVTVEKPGVGYGARSA